MPKRGQTQDWRVAYHYPGARVPVEEPSYVGEYKIDYSRPIDGVAPYVDRYSAESFAREVAGRGGTAELFQVPAEGPRSRKYWQLIATYP